MAMSRRQETPTLTRVTRYGMVNAYLVREDDGLTVVDTGIPKSERFLLAAAQELGAPIVRILLTHAHADHVGSLDALAAELPEAEVLISTRDARLLAGDMSFDPGEPATKMRGGFAEVQTTPTRTLSPGDRVGSLEVVAAPGHTVGQIALLDVRDRTLLCADAFTTWGAVTTSAQPNWRFPLSTMATWDRPIALESARALRDLRPARLAPGHGKVVADPVPAMDRAIAKAA